MCRYSTTWMEEARSPWPPGTRPGRMSCCISTPCLPAPRPWCRWCSSSRSGCWSGGWRRCPGTPPTWPDPSGARTPGRRDRRPAVCSRCRSSPPPGHTWSRWRPRAGRGRTVSRTAPRPDRSWTPGPPGALCSWRPRPESTTYYVSYVALRIQLAQ